MRKVNKDFYTPPSILLSNNCLAQIKEAINQNSGHLYTKTYYGHKEVCDALKLLYKNKCAYCESNISFAATLQVEHYRPKAALHSDNELDINHKGYYWLGNEWSNLLLSCPKCNQQGAKGNKFPIEGVRHFADSAFDENGDLKRENVIITNIHLQNEKPLLLNPENFSENDFPKNHFTFDRFGYITGISKQGSFTIEICNLRREELCAERLSKINEYLKPIKTIIEALKEGKLNDDGIKFLLNMAFSEIEKAQNDTEIYTLWAKYFYHHFEECFISRLHPHYQEGIRIAFAQYKNGTLYP